MHTINFGLKEGENTVYFMQISHNDKRELFFRTLWGEVKPTHFFDWLYNKEFDIQSIDHISFHKDGNIHLRYRDASKKRDKIFDKKLLNTLWEMSMDCYAPLLIFSIHDIQTFKNHIGIDKPQLMRDCPNTSYNFDIDWTNQASFVVFLVWGNVNHRAMLETHFPNMFNINASPFLLNYFWDESKLEMIGNTLKVNDVGLLVACTTRVIALPIEARQVVSSTYMKEMDRIEIPMWLSLTPTDDKIRRLI